MSLRVGVSGNGGGSLDLGASRPWKDILTMDPHV